MIHRFEHFEKMWEIGFTCLICVQYWPVYITYTVLILIYSAFIAQSDQLKLVILVNIFILYVKIFDRRLAAILPRPQCVNDKENSMALLIKSLWYRAQQIMRIDFWGPHAMVIWTILYRYLLTCYALALIRSQRKEYMGQATKLWLSCYLVLLSIDSKTR